MPVTINGNGSITGLAQGGIDGTKVVTAAASAPGNIIQTIHKEMTDSPSTTSTSFQEVTSLSQAITLSSASNKVLVTVVLQCQSWGDEDRRIETQLYHTSVSDSNKISRQSGGEYKSGSSNSYSFFNQVHQILDTPGSTSRTYKVGYKSVDGSNVGVQGSSDWTRSYILLQEISQ